MLHNDLDVMREDAAEAGLIGELVPQVTSDPSISRPAQQYHDSAARKKADD